MLLQSNVHSPQRTAPNFDKVRRMIAVCHGKKAATLQRAEMMLPCPPCMELPFEGSFVCNQGSCTGVVTLAHIGTAFPIPLLVFCS